MATSLPHSPPLSSPSVGGGAQVRVVDLGGDRAHALDGVGDRGGDRGVHSMRRSTRRSCSRSRGRSGTIFGGFDLILRLDKTKFYVIGAGLFTGITVALYLVSVIKTKMQVASKNVAQKNTLSAVRNILKADGIPGLYRGFGTVITGVLPAKIIFLTSLETTKAAALKMIQLPKLSEPVQAALENGIAVILTALALGFYMSDGTFLSPIYAWRNIGRILVLERCFGQRVRWPEACSRRFKFNIGHV